jgi:DNA-binding protein YbaB
MVSQSAMQLRLDELRNQFAQAQRTFAQARDNIGAVSTTTDSQDGRMSVTLDSQGKVTTFTFKDNSFSDLTGEELGTKITELIGQAQGELRAKIAGLMPEPPQGKFSVDRLLDPTTDLMDLLPSDLPGSGEAADYLSESRKGARNHG